MSECTQSALIGHAHNNIPHSTFAGCFRLDMYIGSLCGQSLKFRVLKQLCFNLDIDLRKFYKGTCFGKIDLLLCTFSVFKLDVFHY